MKIKNNYNKGNNCNMCINSYTDSIFGLSCKRCNCWIKCKYEYKDKDIFVELISKTDAFIEKFDNKQ